MRLEFIENNKIHKKKKVIKLFHEAFDKYGISHLNYKVIIFIDDEIVLNPEVKESFALTNSVLIPKTGKPLWFDVVFSKYAFLSDSELKKTIYHEVKHIKDKFLKLTK